MHLKISSVKCRSFLSRSQYVNKGVHCVKCGEFSLFDKAAQFSIVFRLCRHHHSNYFTTNLGQWQNTFNWSRQNGAYMRRQTRPSLVQMMACRLFGTKPFCWTHMGCPSIEPLGTTFRDIRIKIQQFSLKEVPISKYRLWSVGHFALATLCWINHGHKYIYHMVKR